MPIIRGLIDFLALIRSNIELLLDIDPSVIKYEGWHWPIRLGAFLLAVILARILWGLFKKPEHSRKDSGQFMYGLEYRQGFLERLRGFLPKLLVALAMAVILAALAGPFIPQAGEIEEIVQSRIRVDMRDTSTSMEGAFYTTSKSKAQAGHEAHLEFIKMRQGQKDRVSFWLFSSNHYMVQEFTVDDDELYYLQVYDAPWIIYSSCPTDSSLPYGKVPGNRCVNITGDGGGTDFAPALQSVIKYLDRDQESRKAKEGSIVVISDADVYTIPEKELADLKRRGIVTYIIFIAGVPGMDENGAPTFPVIPPFVSRIGEFGGKYFDVRDDDGLRKAYEEINKLEKADVQIKRYVLKRELFQYFISVFIAGLFLAVSAGLLFELLWPRYP